MLCLRLLPTRSSKSAALLVNDSSIGHSPGAITSRLPRSVGLSRRCSSGGQRRVSRMSRNRVVASASLSDCRVDLKAPNWFAQSQFLLANYFDLIAVDGQYSLVAGDKWCI